MQKFNQNQENIQNFEQSSLAPKYKQPQKKPRIKRKGLETSEKAMQNQNDRQNHKILQPPHDNGYDSDVLDILVLKSNNNQLCEFPVFDDFLAINRFHNKLKKNTDKRRNDEDTSYSDVEYSKAVCAGDIHDGVIQNLIPDSDKFSDDEPFEKPKQRQKAQIRKQFKQRDY